jgi:transposase
VQQALEARGARLIYLPPYSPDLSPVEQGWSKLKAYLRKAQARSRETLDHAITPALTTITASDAYGWLRIVAMPYSRAKTAIGKYDL